MVLVLLYIASDNILSDILNKEILVVTLLLKRLKGVEILLRSVFAYEN